MSQETADRIHPHAQLLVQWQRSFGLDVPKPASVQIRHQGTLADAFVARVQDRSPQDQADSEWSYTLAQARKCRLWCDSAQWWIENEGSQLHFAIAGEPLRNNQRRLLCGGDVIELGLHALCVLLTAPHQMTEDEAFGLTDLDQPEPTAHFSQADRRNSPLQEISASLSAKFEDNISQHNSGAQGATLDELAEPLDALHQRYLAALRDPQALISLSGFKPRDADAVDTAHAWGELLDKAQGGTAQLHDAVTAQCSVERIMERLDTMLGVHLLDPEPVADVLALFGPSASEGHPDTGTPASQAFLLPWLTRKEHHGMASDSAMNVNPHTPAGKE